MTQPDAQTPPPQQPQGHPVATAVGVAVAAEAVSKGLPDPFLPLRWARLGSIVRAERKVLTQYRQVLNQQIPKLYAAVVQHRVVDPLGAFSVRQSWEKALGPIIDVTLRDVWKDAFEAQSDWEPDATVHVQRYLSQVRNRMVRTPETVFNIIRGHVTDAAAQGWSPDELAAKIDQTLSTEEGVDNWSGRAMTVARTELIGAYNAGTFAGMVSSAAQMGGDWEKLWLATEDLKTRPTHRAADFHLGGETGQRVPLDQPFIVGGFPLMFPGDPSGPPQEVINCRCTPLMVRPGETPTMTNRQYKGNP